MNQIIKIDKDVDNILYALSCLKDFIEKFNDNNDHELYYGFGDNDGLHICRTKNIYTVQYIPGT